MPQNQHGLSRSIPSNVKQEVRKACGFGCVICGNTIYEYEHFDPDFKDAKLHSADGIALLCPSHHAEVTKGVIPKSIVKKARAEPAALKLGFSRRSLPYFDGDVSFFFGGAIAQNTPIPIRVGGEALFKLGFSRNKSEPTSISAGIRDLAGKHILLVEDNEWRVMGASADFEWVGPRYIFKDERGKEVLVQNFSQENFIICEYIRTYVNGVLLQANVNTVHFGNVRLSMQNAYISDCMEGFCFG